MRICEEKIFNNLVTLGYTESSYNEDTNETYDVTPQFITVDDALNFIRDKYHIAVITKIYSMNPNILWCNEYYNLEEKTCLWKDEMSNPPKVYLNFELAQELGLKYAIDAYLINDL